MDVQATRTVRSASFPRSFVPNSLRRGGGCSGVQTGWLNPSPSTLVWNSTSALPLLPPSRRKEQAQKRRGGLDSRTMTMWASVARPAARYHCTVVIAALLDELGTIGGAIFSISAVDTPGIPSQLSSIFVNSTSLV